MNRAIILRLFDAMLGIGQVEILEGEFVGDGSRASQAGCSNWLENSDEAEMQLNRDNDKKKRIMFVNADAPPRFWSTRVDRVTVE
ncbi:hypothetical protein FOXYSP1_05039 [Fusarium oxysporum f. sp. phaseoli]|jgi:hypothetical protein